MNKQTKTYLIQLGLFIATMITTTLSGAEWSFGKSFVFHHESMGWEEFKAGFWFSIPFLGILTVHEFGHYFMAKKHKVEASLPYYIPLWLGNFTGIGTLGAFIRIREVIKTRLKYFDIGIAGPMAGFLLAVPVLWYGFTHLPPPEHIFSIHPEYKQFGMAYPNFVYQNTEGAIALGHSLLFDYFQNTFADPILLPHPYEMVHYPVILAGFLALFFTALNLIPIGQLDGGHILYALIGDKAFKIVSPTLFYIFVFYGGLGVYRVEEFFVFDNADFLTTIGYFILYIYFNYLCFSRVSDNPWDNWILALTVVIGQLALTYFYPNMEGYSGFLPFIFILGRFLGVYHPPTEDQQPLSLTRKILGWLALIVFILCFSPQPLIVS